MLSMNLHVNLSQQSCKRQFEKDKDFFPSFTHPRIQQSRSALGFPTKLQIRVSHSLMESLSQCLVDSTTLTYPEKKEACENAQLSVKRNKTNQGNLKSVPSAERQSR